MNSTAIQWTDATWNPVTGCTNVSPGCQNCYAQTLHNRRYRANVKAAFAGLSPDELREERGSGWFWPERVRFYGEPLPFPATYDTPFAAVRTHPGRLYKMLRAKKLAGKRVLTCSMGDLFHEDVPDAFLNRVWGVMMLRDDVTFQVLTKRIERAREYLTGLPVANPLPNVWIGTSVEDQQRADERVPALLATPAAVRFLSCEPLLGEVILPSPWISNIDWVIAGGESGPRARPCELAWLRSLRDQCEASGAAFFLKQVGRRPCDVTPGGLGFHLKLHHSHGGDPSEWPEDLRVRQFPEVRQTR